MLMENRLKGSPRFIVSIQVVSLIIAGIMVLKLSLPAIKPINVVLKYLIYRRIVT